MKKSNLEIKVTALNLLNEYAEKYYNYEKTHFAQFLGQNIFKVDGSIKAKYEHPKLEDKGKLSDGTNYNVHYWFDRRYKYLEMRVKICISGGYYDVQPSTAFCEYNETSLSLFQIDETGKLIETSIETKDFSIRYDVKEIEANAKKAKEAAKEYEKICESVPFYFRGIVDVQRLAHN